MTDDRGAIQVLESVIVATLMLTSIVFVVTMNEVSVPPDAAREGLQQRIVDALGILQATPSKSGMGDTLLSSYVASCLQGNCTPLKTKLDRLMPEGSKYALYLSNGQGVYPVYAPNSPSGPSVTARLAFEPRWSSTFVSAAVPHVNPAGDPLVLYALPIYNSNPLTSDGTPVLVTMTGTRVSDGAAFTIQGSIATTASGAAEAAPRTAASLYFVNDTSAVLPTLDARATTLTLGQPSGTPVELRVRLAETGDGLVPAGTRVTITMPPGWTAVASSALNAADWNITANATDDDGSDLTAILTHALTNATADLRLNATYAGGANDYYAIHAAAGGGALARGALLVRADAKPATPTFEVPSLLLGAPRPLGVGSPTTWTLSASLPAKVVGVPAEAVTVTSVTLRADNGDTIFGGVTGLANAGGSWSIVGKNLTWTGSTLLTHEAPFSVAFNATGLAVAKPAVDRAAYTPRVELDLESASLAAESSPGIHRVALPPSGYNASTGAGLSDAHWANASQPYRATDLPGSASYSAGYFSTLQDALFGSVVTVGARNVAAGGTQTVHVAAQPAMFTLASLGYTPSLHLNVYPPWSGDTRIPIYSEVLAPAQVGPNGTYLSLIDGNGDGVPDDETVGIFDATIPVPANSLYGAYVVEVEAKWSEEVSQVVGGQPLSALFERTARVYDNYVVTQPSLVSSPVPVYDAHLVAWFDDWR